MPHRFPPINPRFPHFMHGGDYNPDQWMDTPEVWDEDMRLMKLAGCNTMSIGIFSWAALEPAEGQFNFAWMDTIMDKLARNGAYAVLATPSGSKPPWMSQKYPEVCRMDANGIRQNHQNRHNHCRTSPVYRQKCTAINSQLARRYKDHPALLVWHISNEYSGGECHCPLCYSAFRAWLKDRYHNSLDELNRAWWTRFWSHTFSDWEQIRPVDNSIHGLMLDWQRFNTTQTIDFYKNEIAPLRQHTPQVPITTNFMGFSTTLDYFKFAREVDVVSWDSYPVYHDRPDDWLNAVMVSMTHDLNRSMKGKPFMLMESTPSVVNWKPVNKLKRPGLHTVESLQAVAHGSDTVQYFQFRKGRGGFEKFHGAVVDHCGSDSPNTRVFREVAQVGKILGKLDDVIGAATPADVAILYDWENRWIIDLTSGLRREKRDYLPTCAEHYRPFWSAGVSVDVVDQDCDFSKYKLLIAPMLYMVRPGVAEKIEAFVNNGGTFVTTYLSGIANESDFCFLNGFPGPLRKLMGVWAEETDVLYDDERVKIVASETNAAGLTGAYDASIFCDIIHAEGATVLATYASEFYANTPALTVNRLGQGQAYYIAARTDARFLSDFYRRQIDALKLPRAIGIDLPPGITAQVRTDGHRTFIFLLGFNREDQQLDLGTRQYRNLLTHESLTGQITLPRYSALILEP